MMPSDRRLMTSSEVLKQIDAGRRYESGESLSSILYGTWVSEYEARNFMSHHGYKRLRPSSAISPQMRKNHVLCMSRFGVPIHIIMQVTSYSEAFIRRIRVEAGIHNKVWTPKKPKHPTATHHIQDQA